jgi:hypothetical protein
MGDNYNHASLAEPAVGHWLAFGNKPIEAATAHREPEERRRVSTGGRTILNRCFGAGNRLRDARPGEQYHGEGDGDQSHPAKC